MQFAAMETDPPFLGAVAEQLLGSRGRRVSGTGCYPEMVPIARLSLLPLEFGGFHSATAHDSAAGD